MWSWEQEFLCCTILRALHCPFLSQYRESWSVPRISLDQIQSLKAAPSADQQMTCCLPSLLPRHIFQEESPTACLCRSFVGRIFVVSSPTSNTSFPPLLVVLGLKKNPVWSCVSHHPGPHSSLLCLPDCEGFHAGGEWVRSPTTRQYLSLPPSESPAGRRWKTSHLPSSSVQNKQLWLRMSRCQVVRADILLTVNWQDGPSFTTWLDCWG